MLVALWLLSTGVAVADPNTSDDERAREWFVNGQALYQEGRYRDALVAFDAAYRMSYRPAILRSIAYCHEKLGEMDQALSVLRRYRDLAPPEKWEGIERSIRRIEAHQVAEVEVELQKIDPILEEPAPAPVYDEPPKWKVGTGPLVLYTFAGVGSIVGSIFAVNASRARAQTAELCSEGDAIFCRDSAAKYINQDWLYSLVADTGFGFAGAAVVGGTVWMVLDNSNPNQVQVTAGLQGIGLRGRF